MPKIKYRVIGEWIIEADDKHQAENIVENAVASTPQCVELVECEAEPTDDD